MDLENQRIQIAHTQESHDALAGTTADGSPAIDRSIAITFGIENKEKRGEKKDAQSARGRASMHPRQWEGLILPRSIVEHCLETVARYRLRSIS